MVSIVRVDSNYEDDDGKLQLFCESASSDPHPAAKNMEYHDWKNRPETLMNQIYIQKTYDDGGYYLLNEGNFFTAGCGIYPLELDPNIAVWPVRLYVIPTMSDYKRIKKIGYVPAKVYNEIAVKKFKGVVFFVNDYNWYGIKYASKGWTTDSYIAERNLKLKLFDGLVNYKHTIQKAVFGSWCNYDREIEKCLTKIKSI